MYLLNIEEIPCKFLLGGYACKVVLHKDLCGNVDPCSSVHLPAPCGCQERYDLWVHHTQPRRRRQGKSRRGEVWSHRLWDIPSPGQLSSDVALHQAQRSVLCRMSRTSSLMLSACSRMASYVLEGDSVRCPVHSSQIDICAANPPGTMHTRTCLPQKVL